MFAIVPKALTAAWALGRPVYIYMWAAPDVCVRAHLKLQPRKNSFTKGLRGWANVTNISSLATTATQRKRRSGWGDGLESPVVSGFRAGESLRRRAKKAKKTVDDDERLRHNLTSLLLMQRRRKRSDGAVSWR
ncbi:hypothetical protein, partial [Pandoraea pnomenusa]|uniref:hypothetical protein n=1 Tax=Pandoraea pnomenusa TaxID=93220 RepID=UPI001CD5DBEA